ncbi:DUF6455 family protein [Microvirga splendida]|uniref:DUF6455 family protein n=1 Tax=Microvirga splendida TaxID=2795727 RepID=UPI003CCF8AD3
MAISIRASRRRFAVREQFEGGFPTACRRCLACPIATDCQRWLEGGGADAAPSFCPNAAFLNRVRTSAGP